MDMKEIKRKYREKVHLKFNLEYIFFFAYLLKWPQKIYLLVLFHQL